MEFSLAADGKASELRAWLTANPQRVNLPNTFTNYTLVYTATVHSNRSQKPTISSLQAAKNSGERGSVGSPHLQTIRMMCQEFGADPCIPCGGLQSSCIFAAAEIGAEDVLLFFFNELDPIDEGNTQNKPHRFFMKPNSLGETPLQAARRVKASASLIALLEKRANLEKQLLQTPKAANPARPTTNSTTTSASSAVVTGAVVHRDPNSNVNVANTTTSLATKIPLKTPPPPRTASNSGSSSSPTAQSLRDRLFQLRIQDSDSDDDVTTAAAVNAPPPRSGQIGRPITATSSTALPAVYSSANTTTTTTNTNNTVVVVQRRNEQDISQYHQFSNRDLQEFRHVFGNGFTYVQCRDHYDIRGLLPYTYRGTEYYTPMIFLIYGPHPPPYYNNVAMSSNAAKTGNSSGVSTDPGMTHPNTHQYGVDSNVSTSAITPMPAATASSSSSSPSSPLASGLIPYSRYRALVDIARMDGFCINRKAEYIDPVSGAIVPCACDGIIFNSLISFVNMAVTRNFERVPPMTPAGSRYAFAIHAPIALLGTAEDKFIHHHSQSSPSDMRNLLSRRSRVMQEPGDLGEGEDEQSESPSVTENSARSSTVKNNNNNNNDNNSAKGIPGPRTRLRYFRICQDLSRFGDGWLRYHANGDFVNGFLPIYREKPKAAMTTVYGVAAAAAAAASTTSTLPAARRGGGARPPPKMTQEVVAIEVQLVFTVRLQIRFQDTVDGHALPSRAPIVYLVNADATSPSHQLTFDAFRPLLTGGDPSSCAARSVRADILAPVLGQFAEGQSTLFDVLCVLQDKCSSMLERFAKQYQAQHGSPLNARAPGELGAAQTAMTGGSSTPRDHSSPLDDLFASPTVNEATAPCANFPSHAAIIGTGGVCVVCFSNQTTMVLQPCGHIALCKVCADGLENHNHNGRFPCPVCHGTVTSLEEVYL